MNINAKWKYLVLLLLLVFAVVYALPNLYRATPGIQIIGVRDFQLEQNTVEKIQKKLAEEKVTIESYSFVNNKIQLKFSSEQAQTQAQTALKKILPQDKYGVALADFPSTPQWMQSLGSRAMYLGLDLRGGVHFLLQIDMDAALKKAQQNYVDDLKSILRDEKIRYRQARIELQGNIHIKFSDEAMRERAMAKLSISNPELQLIALDKDGAFFVIVKLSEKAIAEIKKAAASKNMIALRNRIDQLGVSEPVIQQQGSDRIVVQLPGVKDPAVAKSIIGKTATLEVRLVADENSAYNSSKGRVPAGTKRYFFRNGTPILLKKRLILSGENIVDASSGIDQQNGGSIVNIVLDGKGATVWGKVTGKNINKNMAVVYVEDYIERKYNAQGEDVSVRQHIEEVITAPRILSQLGKRFMITGMSGAKEAKDLALLLKAGSLAAPMFIIEERTVGPSLGKDNIEKGFKSVVYGFLAVLIFMIVYYRVFGAIASFALVLNLVLIVSVLSLLQATLTLPGVAGMVLTVGMAVDANVLIFERIREEIRDGSPPQLSIHRGYDNAFSTIIDANITTLIAALILFTFGTGPVKGFAITLSIGIITSMITAIFVSRIMVNFFYGKRRINKLSI